LKASENLMPHPDDAVKAYATLGEICDAPATVFGALRRKSPSPSNATPQRTFAIFFRHAPAENRVLIAKLASTATIMALRSLLALRDAGMEVILHRTAADTRKCSPAAEQEDGTCGIGLSILPASKLCPRLMELLHAKHMEDGLCWSADYSGSGIPGLKKAGIAEIFLPGTPTVIVDFVRTACEIATE
jgi:methylmalonyl-CoA mutase C-terminal domain/subunit